VLALQMRPERRFTKILQSAHSGQTGTTYAFDAGGVFLSQSADDEKLKEIGLLPDRPGETSVLNLEVRDPGVDMTAGRRPALRPAEQPLTRMAAEATAGRGGVDVDGYRDYRGVPVVGAWRWLPEYDFGVATEASVAEAFRPSFILRRAFWVMLGLLGLLAVTTLALVWFLAWQHRALRKAELATRNCGADPGL
jgi:hypothetical protein